MRVQAVRAGCAAQTRAAPPCCWARTPSEMCWLVSPPPPAAATALVSGWSVCVDGGVVWWVGGWVGGGWGGGGDFRVVVPCGKASIGVCVFAPTGTLAQSPAARPEDKPGGGAPLAGAEAAAALPTDCSITCVPPGCDADLMANVAAVRPWLAVQLRKLQGKGPSCGSSPASRATRGASQRSLIDCLIG